MRKTYYLIIGFFYLISYKAVGQDQKVADSLATIYAHYSGNDTIKLELLRNLAFNEVNDLPRSLKYAEELISLSTQQGNYRYLYRGYLQKGNKKRLLGNLEEALAAFFKSAEAAKNAHYLPGEGTAYGAIADVYSLSNHHGNAILYYNKSIATLRVASDSIALAAAISNAGDEYLNYKSYDSALLYFNESGIIYDKLDYEIGKAYTLGNIGMVYGSIGKDQLAEKNINESIVVLEKLEDYYPICVYLIAMADIYSENGHTEQALRYAARSLALAKKYRLKDQIGDANLKLSHLYEKIGDTKKSLQYFKDHVVYRDSVNNINAVQKMADMRTNFEVAQKQTEVDLLNEHKRNQQIIQLSSVSFLIIIIAGLLFLVWQKKQSNKKLMAINLIMAETNASKDKLFSIISHDIKGPLHSLMVMSKLFMNDAVKLSKEEVTMLTEGLESSIKNLFTLLENLLEWSLSQTGHIDFKPDTFDICVAMKENIELLRDQANQKNILINGFQTQAYLVHAHYNSVSTVIRNLLSNAVKFTPEGGHINLHCEVIGKLLHVSVRDSGMGIHPTILPTLFKIDKRNTLPGTRNERGTGLGLMLCKDFVERNGGTIKVDSIVGKGATFMFTLPFVREESTTGVISAPVLPELSEKKNP